MDEDYKTISNLCNNGNYDSLIEYENINTVDQESVYYLLRGMFYKHQDIESWLCEEDNSDEETQRAYNERISGIEKCTEYIKRTFNVNDATYKCIVGGNYTRRYRDYCKEKENNLFNVVKKYIKTYCGCGNEKYINIFNQYQI